MHLIDDTRATLPTPLTDAIETHLGGLRRLRLLRVKGQSGATHLAGAAWSFETQFGAAPQFGELPDVEAEDVADTVHARALAALAEGGKDRRFRVDLTRALEDGSEETLSVGFQLDDAAAAAAVALEGTDRAGASQERLNLSMVAYIDKLHAQNVALLNGAGRGMRAVVGTLPTLIQVRLDALEDRVEATLERGGVSAPTGDEPWRAEAMKGIRELMVAVAPGIFSGKDAPAESLRGKLQALGKTFTAEQLKSLVALAGGDVALKLKKAGGADDDIAAAGLMVEVVQAVDAEAFGEILTEAQREQLDSILTMLEQVLDSVPAPAPKR